MQRLVLAAFATLVATTAQATYVPYCSVTAAEGQNLVKWAGAPTPGVTPASLCELAKSELRFTYGLTPTGAQAAGYIDNAGSNYAYVRCQDGFVQYLNGFGLGIVNAANQASANHYQCLFYINSN